MGNIRRTWGQVKDQVGLPLGYCGDDPALLPLVNEGCELLWNAGDWIHKMARYKFRVGSNCGGVRIITWPTEIETIEALEICNRPISVKNLYYEFLNNALGNIDGNPLAFGDLHGAAPFAGRYTMLGDREEACTFEDLIPGQKKVKAYNSLPADNGTQVTLMGYDDNNQWIRTLQNGVYADGEVLTLNASSSPETVNYFSSITGVQFSVTPRNGAIFLTEFNVVDNVERTIAAYQYNEQTPVYRRSVLSGVRFNNCQFVTGLVRLRFIPIIYPTDYLQIDNISAIKNILLSLQKRDNGDLQNTEGFKQMAIKVLDDELRQYQGIAPKKNISFQSRALWGTSANMR